MLIVNADDYGATRQATQNTLIAFKAGAVTSASLMVFMEDTEFAAEQALVSGLDTGIHLNFTTPMTGPKVEPGLVGVQEKVSRFLLKNKFSQLFYNPHLARQFKYLYIAQTDEFIRLFKRAPSHIDGHHHMHLCANALFGCNYPHSTWVRRNFTFHPGSKGYLKWVYRTTSDKWLGYKYRTTDYFNSIEPVEDKQRLLSYFQIAADYLFELEVHPARENELEFLIGEEFKKLLGNTKLTSFAELS
jgi:predicted glycoside hydrolase/deacetylase ChbG (UPF0249 family)